MQCASLFFPQKFGQKRVHYTQQNTGTSWGKLSKIVKAVNKDPFPLSPNLCLWNSARGWRHAAAPLAVQEQIPEVLLIRAFSLLSFFVFPSDRPRLGPWAPPPPGGPGPVSSDCPLHSGRLLFLCPTRQCSGPAYTPLLTFPGSLVP